SWNWRHEYVSENYVAEVGYVPRTGYYKLNPSIGYLFFPKSKRILNHGPQLSTMLFFDKNWKQTDALNLVEYNFRLRRRSSLNVWAGHDFVQLQDAVDPTNYSGDTLAAGTEHRWYGWGAKSVSKPQSLCTCAVSTRRGGYYANGSMTDFAGEVGYRF